MSAQNLTSAKNRFNGDAAMDSIREAKTHLAAAHRLAVRDELEEGIDNHFTVTVPGTEDQYLILPFGLHWSEATASDMITFDEAGTTLDGEGDVELSALCIHAPIHRLTGARVVMHTHQHWAVALNLLKNNRLLPLSQTAAYFCGHIAYDDTYAGTADHVTEGERLATLLQSDTQVLFMKNHGILVLGDTVAQAYRRLYILERVCRAQVCAMSTGQPLEVLSDDIVARVQADPDDDKFSTTEREAMYFAAMMRVLDRDHPGYAE